MNENYQCPKCGQPVPQNAPEGLCPRCLGALNLDSESGVTGTGATATPPPSAAELAPHFPQLEVLELLGRGGMGVVYKVRQKELDRIAALKILPPGIGGEPAFAERFAREAKALARLNHPGIVTIYDSGRTDGLFYFLMEFVEGVSLGRLMRGARVSPREALAIVPQICDALQYAHDQGIVHRDIKPENILLDRQGRVKVADFGLAKLLGTESGRAGSPLPAGDSQADGGAHGVTRPTDALTDAGRIMGTPAYMAPEQAEHPAAVDHRADIYALGVVFYQMLTGELPSQRLDPPSRKVQIDVRLDEVVLRALEKEPERRYQQVSQVKTAVETILQTAVPDAVKGQSGLEGRAIASNARTGSRAGAWPRSIYIGVAAGIAAGLAGWFCWQQWLSAPGFFEGTRNRGAVKQVSPTTNAAPVGHVQRLANVVKQISATTVRKGDLGVHLDLVGSVESSNSAIFAIPESYCQKVINKFNARQALTVEAYNSQGERFGHGFLAAVDDRVDPTTATLKCKASLIPEAGNLMVPGRFLNISMLLEVKRGVTLVPADAILRGAQSAFAWVVQPDHRAARRPVRVGTVEGKWAEIQSGVSPGEVVISGGAEDLREGQMVRYDLAPKGESDQAGAQPGKQPSGQNATMNISYDVGTPANQSPASPRTVEEVLARYTQGRGGLAVAQGTTTLMAKGTFESRDGLGTLEVEALLKSPDKWRMALADEQGPVWRRAFDGAAGWEVSKWGGSRGVDAATLLTGRILSGLYRGEQLATFLPNLSLKGKETIAGQEACVLEVAVPRGQPPKLWFETQTGLLVRIQYAVSGSQLQLDLDDYRDVGGLMLPFTLRQTGSENWTVRCREAKRNEPIEDSQFKRPASQ